MRRGARRISHGRSTWFGYFLVLVLMSGMATAGSVAATTSTGTSTVAGVTAVACRSVTTITPPGR